MWADSFVLAQLQLFPELASKEGAQIDALYWFINIVSIVMTVVIFVAIGFFAYKYPVARTSTRYKLRVQRSWN